MSMAMSIPQRLATIVIRGCRDEANMECSSDRYAGAERACTDLSPRRNKVDLRDVPHDRFMEDESGVLLQAR